MTAEVTGAAREEGEQVVGTAQSEAAAVGGAAASAAQDVVDTAAEQAGAVAGESVRSLRDLLGEVRDELNLQASTQTMRAGEVAYSLADELEGMAESSEQQGAAADVARQVAHRARRVGEFLQSRDPDQLLEEVRLLARRRPGAFLLGAAAAGVVAGRLGRGAAAARQPEAPAAPPVAPEAPAVPVAPVVAPAPPVQGAEGEQLGQETAEPPVTAAGRAAVAEPPPAPRDLSGPARRTTAEARRSATARRARP